MSSINLDQLFLYEEGADGVSRRAIPTALYDSVCAEAGETKQLNFGGGDPDPDAERLYERDEARAARIVVENIAGWVWLCEMAGLNPGRAWSILELHRNRLVGLPIEPVKPGDFDVVMGVTTDDGMVSFDELVCVEFKLRKVRGDGEPRQFASGTGTGQARGAAQLGFDRVVLAHILVGESRDLPPGYAPTWGGLVNLNFDRAILGSAGKVRDAERAHNNTGPYGYVVFGIGQIPGVDAARTGAISYVRARVAPDRPLRYNATAVENGRRLREAMRRLLGVRRPARKILEIGRSLTDR